MSYYDYRNDYGQDFYMITVSKSKLKAKMLEYFRTVEETGEEIIVTNHGKPVIKVVAIQQKLDPDVIFAAERGNVVYMEDPLTDTADEWPET